MSVGSWLGANGFWAVPLATVVCAAAYVLWVGRRDPVYRWSSFIEYPLDDVFDAYYPRPGQDLTGHRLEGLTFLFVGRGVVEVGTRDGGVHNWTISRPHECAWVVGPITIVTHRFRAVDGGTQVDTELTCRFPRLWSRLTSPFMGWSHALSARDYLRRTRSPAPRSRPIPLLAFSALPALVFVTILGVVAWLLGWLTAVLFGAVLVAHGTAATLAARAFGHAASRFDLLGLAGSGTPSRYAEVAATALAGPAAGFATCLVLYGVAALLHSRTTMAAVSAAVVMHGIVLLPIPVFPGGVVMRAVVISIGRNGQIVWTIVGGLCLAVATFVLVWRMHNWVALPFLALGAVLVFGERFVADDLPRMSKRELATATAVYALLVVGHIALARAS